MPICQSRASRASDFDRSYSDINWTCVPGEEGGGFTWGGWYIQVLSLSFQNRLLDPDTLPSADFPCHRVSPEWHVYCSFGFLSSVLQRIHISRYFFHTHKFGFFLATLLWYISAFAVDAPKLSATNPFVSVLSKPFSAESVLISIFLDLLTWTRHPPLDHISYEQGVLGQHKLGFHTGYVTAPGIDPWTLQYCSVQNLTVTKTKAKKFWSLLKIFQLYQLAEDRRKIKTAASYSICWCLSCGYQFGFKYMCHELAEE